MEENKVNIINPEFSKANWERSSTNFNGSTRANTYWVTALAGELGEVAEIVKKLERGFTVVDLKKSKEKFIKVNKNDNGELPEIPENAQLQKMWVDNKVNSLAKELADIFIYLDLSRDNSTINRWKKIKNKNP